MSIRRNKSLIAYKHCDPYFVAKDVAEILGYKKPENAIAAHCKAQVTTPKQGGGFFTIIPERDIYRLVMKSKLPTEHQTSQTTRNSYPISNSLYASITMRSLVKLLIKH